MTSCRLPHFCTIKSHLIHDERRAQVSCRAESRHLFCCPSRFLGGAAFHCAPLEMTTLLRRLVVAKSSRPGRRVSKHSTPWPCKNRKQCNLGGRFRLCVSHVPHVLRLTLRRQTLQVMKADSKLPGPRPGLSKVGPKLEKANSAAITLVGILDKRIRGFICTQALAQP